MKQLKNVMLTCGFLFFATALFAQYTGPGSEAKSCTVKSVIDKASKLDRRDVLVRLQGYVVAQIKDDKFTFSDKTGSVRVEIDQDVMPDFKFDDKTALVIYGEVESDMLKGVEVDVKKIELAK